MKGVVFKSFEAFLENRWSDDLLDQALSQPNLTNDGAYTSVGDYPHDDMISLAVFVSQATETPLNELIKSFGEYLFGILANAHGDIIAGFTSCVDMLAGIESVIHRDVRKLYSNAELPTFDVAERDGNKSITIVYRSARPFADLAEGLILGALGHYGVKENASLNRYDYAENGTHSSFALVIGHENTTK